MPYIVQRLPAPASAGVPEGVAAAGGEVATDVLGDGVSTLIGPSCACIVIFGKLNDCAEKVIKDQYSPGYYFSIIGFNIVELGVYTSWKSCPKRINLIQNVASLYKKLNVELLTVRYRKVRKFVCDFISVFSDSAERIRIGFVQHTAFDKPVG